MAKCHDCIFFSDLGACRNGHSRRNDVGYFTEACDLFQDQNEAQKPMEEKPKNTHTCKQCGRTLPLEQFKRNRYGFTYICLDCAKANFQAARRKGAKAEPEPEKEEPAPPTPCTLAAFTLAEIAAELKARGYKGTIQKIESFEI